MEIFKARSDFSRLVEWIFCREKHKDGQYHLHAWLKFDVPVPWTKDLFDMNGYHGNYQVARSWKAVQFYIVKAGDYLSSFDVERALTKHGKVS